MRHRCPGIVWLGIVLIAAFLPAGDVIEMTVTGNVTGSKSAKLVINPASKIP